MAWMKELLEIMMWLPRKIFSREKHADLELQPGDIQHDSLPPEMLEQIRALYEVIGPYVSDSLEQFEIGFMRDANPANEIAIWYCISEGWLTYHQRFLGEAILSEQEEKKLIGALIAISTGVNDVSVLGVPEDVGRKLLNCYGPVQSQ